MEHTKPGLYSSSKCLVKKTMDTHPHTLYGFILEKVTDERQRAVGSGMGDDDGA